EEEAARREIEAIIKTRDRDEWFALLTKADVCVGKVYEVEEMVRDPQINHRQMIVDVEHPKHGRVRQVGIAIKLSDTPGTNRSSARLASKPIDGPKSGVLACEGWMRKNSVRGYFIRSVVRPSWRRFWL